MLIEVKTTLEGVNDTSFPSQARWKSGPGKDLLLVGFKHDDGWLVAAETMNWFLKRACWVKNTKGELSAWWMLGTKWFESEIYKNSAYWRDYQAEGLADLRYVEKGAIYNWGLKHRFHYKGRRYWGEEINFGWDFDGIIHGCNFRDMENHGLAGKFDERMFRRYVLGLGTWLIGYMFEFDSEERINKLKKRSK